MEVEVFVVVEDEVEGFHSEVPGHRQDITTIHTMAQKQIVQITTMKMNAMMVHSGLWQLLDCSFYYLAYAHPITESKIGCKNVAVRANKQGSKKKQKNNKKRTQNGLNNTNKELDK